MKRLLLATTLALGATPMAHAALILGFTQFSSTNTVTATTNAGDTQTTITVNGAVADIGGSLNPVVNPQNFFLTATSVGTATESSGQITQLYSGSFCFSTSGTCTPGVNNTLSGTFSDAAFGGAGGPGLTINVNNPAESLVLASDGAFKPAQLDAPNALSFAFSNIATPPGLSIVGTTIAPFTASFSGTVSATPTPEPVSLALLGTGLLGLGFVVATRRRR